MPCSYSFSLSAAASLYGRMVIPMLATSFALEALILGTVASKGSKSGDRAEADERLEPEAAAGINPSH